MVMEHLNGLMVASILVILLEVRKKVKVFGQPQMVIAMKAALKMI
jgi:hypothetical protein